VDVQHQVAVLYSAADDPEAMDLVQAYKWANLSAALGHSAAPKLRESLKQRMSRRQIAEAQRLSRSWYERRSRSK
jgi:TPR repeat protein